MDIKFVLFYLSNRCEEMKVNVSLGALNFGFGWDVPLGIWK